MQYVIDAIAGYLLGSLTFCQIFARLRGKDLGNNLGGSAYLQVTQDKAGAVVCVLLDVLKGAAAFYFFGPVGAVFAVIGHMWSLFFGFRGGRGGATTAGIFLLADWRILVLYVLYTVARLPFIREREKREEFDQWARVALLFVLPFTGYEYWQMLEAIVAAIVIKYATVRS